MARWAKAILALVGLFLLFIIIYWLLNFFIIKNVFNYTVQNFVSVSGISPWLIRGLVILILIPFGWALLEVTKLFPKISGSLFHIKIRSHRKFGIFIIISYVALFFIAMYLFSRHNLISKYYWIGPKGKIYISDTDGIVKKNLEPKKKVTKKIAEMYIQQEKGEKPKRIDTSKEIEFFDSITGKPIVWYYKDSQGNYEFYDHPGFHSYGYKLLPITNEIVSDYKKKLIQKKEELIKRKKAEEEEERSLKEKERIKEEKRRRIEEKKRKLREKEKRKQEKLVMRKAYIERYINTMLYNDPSRAEIGLLICDKKTMALSQGSRIIGNKIRVNLAKENIKTFSDLFKIEFITDGNFRNLYQGDIQDIFDLEVKNYIDYLILGTKEAIFSKLPPLRYFISCNLLIDLKIYSAQTGEIIAINSFKEVGVGDDNREAEQTAINKIIEKVKIFIMNNESIRFSVLINDNNFSG